MERTGETGVRDGKFQHCIRFYLCRKSRSLPVAVLIETNDYLMDLLDDDGFLLGDSRGAAGFLVVKRNDSAHFLAEMHRWYV